MVNEAQAFDQAGRWEKAAAVRERLANFYASKKRLDKLVLANADELGRDYQGMHTPKSLTAARQTYIKALRQYNEIGLADSVEAGSSYKQLGDVYMTT